MNNSPLYPAPYDEEEPLFLDTETCGLAGFPVLIQFKIGRHGPVVLHHIGHTPAIDTIELIEFLIAHKGGHVGFNYTFDMFMLIKCYNVLMALEPEQMCEWVVDLMDEIEEVETRCFKNAIALKPTKINDLMLFARSTALQMCMNRKDLVLRRVPVSIAQKVEDLLNEKIKLPGILFSRRKKNKSVRFVAEPIVEEDQVDLNFMDIKLRFAPSTGLKAIAAELGVCKSERLLYDEVAIDSRYYPQEYEFAPFAKMTKDPDRRWTLLFKKHCDHWIKSLPREYAEDDVHDTAGVYYYFMDNPEEYGVPDWDSVDNSLVSMVSNTRYRGFKIDLDQIRILHKRAKAVLAKARHNFRSHQIVRKYILLDLDEAVEMILTDPHTGKISTKGDNLKVLANLLMPGPVCDDCYGEGCEKCSDGLIPIMETIMVDGVAHERAQPHPAALKAQEILEFRYMQKEVELYDKLLICGYIFPDVKIIGAKSSRMAGAGGFNFQGVKNADYVREAFVLKDEGENLQIGDLDAFEVSIMAAVYNDPGMVGDLKAGKKIHALFAEALFPDKSYDEICATKSLPKELDLYGKGKSGIFCMLYGGSENKIAESATVDVQVAANAIHNFGDRYPKWKEKFQATIKRHSMLVQSAGVGSKIEIADAREYAETLFGFRRFFDIDYQMIREVFSIARDIPKDWYKIRGRVVRKDKEQSVVGACRTALYSGAFGLQSAIIRQAQNHEIQGSGAYVTKVIQQKVWELQPTGIHPLVIRAIQIHDEVICVGKPYLKEKVSKTVLATVETFRPRIPLIGMSWDDEATSWADK